MSRNSVNITQLSDSTNGAWSALSMSSGSTYTSTGYLNDSSAGFNALELISTAGTLAITYELSNDNSNWRIPYDTDGNALNDIATAQGVTTGLIIVFGAQIGKYIRIKITPSGSDSTVTAKLITKENM